MDKTDLSLEDEIRIEMLKTITRSYGDRYPLSYLMLELIRLTKKYNFKSDKEKVWQLTKG